MTRPFTQRLAGAACLSLLAAVTITGCASGLIGLLQFGCGFIASSAIAATQNCTPYPMTLTMAVCGLSGTLLWFIGSSRQNAG